MVTEAGKELLRNTIHTAKFHNRILEENVMWKQWELERGLTMMVSDDDILRRIKKHHQCSKHRKRDKTDDKDRHKKSSEASKPLPSSSEKTERWDHSGFLELYPEEFSKNSSSSASAIHPKKQKKKKKRRHSKSSSSDTEIWEEFKRYKRSKTKKHKSKSKGHSQVASSGFDNHVKEWKKHMVEKRESHHI